MKSPNNSSSTTADTTGGTVIIVKNQLKPSGRLKLVLTSDGTGSNGNVNVIILPSWTPSNPGLAGKLPDGQHITLTAPNISSVATEVTSYLQNVKMHITKVTVTTSDTDNFNGGNQLTIGKVSPDGRNNESADIPFETYKKMSGSAVSDTLVIDDQDFTTGGNFYMKIATLKLNTTMTFLFDVVGTNDNAVITSRN